MKNTVEKAGKRQLLRNTDMLIRAARTGALKFLTHPGEKAPADMLKIALACAESGTLLEINTHHMSLTVGMLKLIMHTDVRFILSSDAHAPKRVGDFQAGIDLIIESGLDPARVENLIKIE